MRENKYRAWDEIEKNFWYFTLQEILERRMSYRGSFDEKILNGEKDEYIGLNDCKQNEIYNRDIVKGINRNYDNKDNIEDYYEIFKVTYLNGCYMFGNWNAHEFFNRFTRIEVVGNAFENPNLIK